MASILAVGNDPALLYTRALVLARANAFIETAAPQAAPALLKSHRFDLVVLCHSISGPSTDALVEQIRSAQPACKVLLVGSAFLLLLAGDGEEHFDPQHGPQALLRMVSRLLQGNHLPSLKEGAASPAPRQSHGDNVIPHTCSSHPRRIPSPPSREHPQGSDESQG